MSASQSIASATSPTATARAVSFAGLRSAESRSTTEQLFSCSQEEIARVAQILRGLHCGAVMCGPDGTALPFIAAPCGAGDPSLARRTCLEVPIYGSEDAPLAILEVTPNDADYSSTLDTMLRPIMQATARAIAERWFRIGHRCQWILVAQRESRPDNAIILAIDDRRRVVGADRHARQLVAARGSHFAPDCALSEFFEVGALSLRGYVGCDIATRLVDAADATVWSALITPPNPYVARPVYAEQHLLFHARPRMDAITCVSCSSQGDAETRGLPPRMLQRIRDYIDNHLDHRLNVDELATQLGISPSHFARSFGRSVGTTPHDYVMRRRLLRAQELLAQSDLSLVEIALRAGFADQSHFSRRFHQFMGLPPKAFRDRCR